MAGTSLRIEFDKALKTSPAPAASAFTVESSDADNDRWSMTGTGKVKYNHDVRGPALADAAMNATGSTSATTVLYFDDAIEVTVEVTDVNEPTGAVTDVTASRASRTSLSVSWTAPADTGALPVATYDLRWFAGGRDPRNETDWTEVLDVGAGTSATLEGAGAEHGLPGAGARGGRGCGALVGERERAHRDGGAADGGAAGGAVRARRGAAVRVRDRVQRGVPRGSSCRRSGTGRWRSRTGGWWTRSASSPTRTASWRRGCARPEKRT